MLYGEENHGYKNATRRVAGKKIKGRGGKKIKSNSRIYTPGILLKTGSLNRGLILKERVNDKGRQTDKQKDKQTDLQTDILKHRRDVCLAYFRDREI